MKHNEYSVDSQLDLGHALAKLYIAAQGVSPIASDAAMELSNKGTYLVRSAFEQTLEKADFKVRGLSLHQPLFG